MKRKIILHYYLFRCRTLKCHIIRYVIIIALSILIYMALKAGRIFAGAEKSDFFCRETGFMPGVLIFNCGRNQMLSYTQGKKVKAAFRYKICIFVFDSRCKAFTSCRCAKREYKGRLQTDFENILIIKEIEHIQIDMTATGICSKIYNGMKHMVEPGNLDL